MPPIKPGNGHINQHLSKFFFCFSRLFVFDLELKVVRLVGRQAGEQVDLEHTSLLSPLEAVIPQGLARPTTYHAPVLIVPTLRQAQHHQK